MLRKIRILAATLTYLLLTLLFLDFTGTTHLWFGWIAKIQFVPALLALQAGILLALVLFTWLFGRIYCSVVCPLGIFQDGVSHLAGLRKNNRKRFRYTPPRTALRLAMLALFATALVAGISIPVSLLDPYAAYGRIATTFLSPLYQLANNLLAWLAERANSYAFYNTEIHVKGWITLGIAALTLALIALLAWRNGRTYCNTLCPVGTILGMLSRYSLGKPLLDTTRCTGCKACERRCKANCINTATHRIDYSRCVTCFNCIQACQSGAMTYRLAPLPKKATQLPTAATGPTQNLTRRNALSLLGLLTLGHTLKAQQLHVDGGLATILPKQPPTRKTPLVPPGARNAQHLKARCTACQLCISACPNHVLCPSDQAKTLMQPQMTFENGYCRPECTQCSHVCPTGAICPISAADKAALSIGHAIWIAASCVVNTDEIQCNNCQRHCPTGAITLVERDPGFSDSLKIPAIDLEKCIGCGACENLCPARPLSAIYVEGNATHQAL